MPQRQGKTMMCCKNICFVILVVSIGIGNGESNEDLQAMERNFLKMNQAIESRLDEIQGNFLKMNQAIEQIWQKLDSENNPADERLAPTEVTQVTKMNDKDLEERVEALELQLENVQEDLSFVVTEVTDLEEDVEAQITILQADQVNQDERIAEVEDVSEGLDTRLATLEDEDGSDESVTEAINKLNSDVLYLNGTVLGLQSADIEIDSRLETLEELDVNSEIENLDSRLDSLELDGTVAFHVGFTDASPVVPLDVAAVWDFIFFNHGDGYNKATGEFVVPPGGAGLYYFNVHFLFDDGEVHWLNIRHNRAYLCQVMDDNRQSGDYGGSACGALEQLAEGDVVDVYHWGGTDDTPCAGAHRSTFSGFRIAPA